MVSALSITDLPSDLLTHIFKRVPAPDDNTTRLAAVCRAFRRVCHTHATTVIITRPYEPSSDSGTLATLAQLPQLRAVHFATTNEPRSWSWPISAFTNVTRLSVCEGWPAKELPPALAVVSLKQRDYELSVLQLNEFFMRALPPGCAVEVSGLNCTEDRSWNIMAGWAQRVHLSAVWLSSTWRTSPGCLRGLAPSQLRCIDIFGAGGLKTLDGIEHCSALTSLSIWSCGKLTSLQSLTQAHMPALECLKVDDCPLLTELEELSNERLPKLTLLRVGNCTAVAHLAVANPTGLTSLSVGGCSFNFTFVTRCSPSLRELSLWAMPGLQSLDWHPATVTSLLTLQLDQCALLTSLRGLRAGGCVGLQSLSVCKCPLAALYGVAEAQLSRLTCLRLCMCKGLVSLASLSGAGLVSLRVLDLGQCAQLSSLAGLAAASVTALTTLDLRDCGALTSLHGIVGAGLGQLVELNLRGCKGLHSLYDLWCLEATSAAQPCVIDMRGCTKIQDPAAQIKALRAAGINAVASEM